MHRYQVIEVQPDGSRAEFSAHSTRKAADFVAGQANEHSARVNGPRYEVRDTKTLAAIFDEQAGGSQ